MKPKDDSCRDLYLDLLKRALSNTIYGDHNISPGAATSEYSEELRRSGRDWPAVAHTMIGSQRLNNLQWCVEQAIAEGVPGDLIETGVWRGGASILMRGILKVYAESGRKVWVADSFEGLPKPDPELYPADAGDIHHAYAELAVSLDEVKENFRRYDLLDEQVCFVKGWFRDTLPTLPAEQFAVIRLDGDMYESTMVALQSLYPKLSVGGFVIVDDYGAIDGCRHAIDDFRDANGIFDPIHQADWTGVYWKKSAAPEADESFTIAPTYGTLDGISFSERTGGADADPVIIPRGLTAAVHGWAVDVGRDRPASRVLLQVDDRKPERASLGVVRSDVVQALGSAGVEGSGFCGSLSTIDLPPGRHVLRAFAIASDGSKLPLADHCQDFIVSEGLEDYVRNPTTSSPQHLVIDEILIDGVAVGGAAGLGPVSRNLTIRGWAVDRARAQSASAIFAVIGSRVVAGSMGRGRPDVALALSDDHLARSGYEFTLPALAFSPGPNTLVLRAFTPDGMCLESPAPIVVIGPTP